MSLVKKVGKRTLAVIMVFLVAGIAIGAVLVTSNTITINQHVNVVTTGVIRAELTSGTVGDVEAGQQAMYSFVADFNMNMKNVTAHVRVSPIWVMDDLATGGIFPSPSYINFHGQQWGVGEWSEGENGGDGWVETEWNFGDVSQGREYGELAISYGAPGDYTVELYFTGETG